MFNLLSTNYKKFLISILMSVLFLNFKIEVFLTQSFKDENAFCFVFCLFFFRPLLVLSLFLRWLIFCNVANLQLGWKKKLSLSCRVIQKQMAFMLGRHGMFLELNEDVEESEDLTEIMSNVQLNSNFLALAREVRGTEELRNYLVL